MLTKDFGVLTTMFMFSSSPVDPETGSKSGGRDVSLILLTLLKVEKG